MVFLSSQLFLLLLLLCRPATFPKPKAATALLRPILNITIPAGFNPAENIVEMQLQGSWSKGVTGDTKAVLPAPPIGGVALMRDGQVLAYTFPSELLGNNSDVDGNFYYGATWVNVGLPLNGTVEVWAGMQVSLGPTRWQLLILMPSNMPPMLSMYRSAAEHIPTKAHTGQITYRDSVFYPLLHILKAHHMYKRCSGLPGIASLCKLAAVWVRHNRL